MNDCDRILTSYSPLNVLFERCDAFACMCVPPQAVMSHHEEHLGDVRRRAVAVIVHTGHINRHVYKKKASPPTPPS